MTPRAFDNLAEIVALVLILDFALAAGVAMWLSAGAFGAG